MRYIFAQRVWNDRHRVTVITNIPSQHHSIGSDGKPAISSHSEVPAERKKPEIGLTGFDIIFNSESSFWKRLYWVAVFVLCTCLCFYQISNCVIQYIEQDPSVSVRLEKRLQREIPSVTFCPGSTMMPDMDWHDWMTRYQKQFNESATFHPYYYFYLNLSDVDVLKLMEKYRVRSERVEVDVHCSVSKRENKCMEPAEIRNVSAAVGKCVTVTFNSPMRIYGLINWVRILYNSSTSSVPFGKFYLEIYRHASDVSSRFFSNRTGHSFARGLTLRIAIIVSEEIRINRTRKPCFSREYVAKCLEDCLDDYLEGNLTCRLPFMIKSQKPICETPEDYIQAKEKADEILQYYPNVDCGCPRICHKIHYSENVDSRVRFKNLYTAVEFNFPNEEIMVQEEYFIYSFTILICDIGGAIGIFLDLSVLGLLDLFEFLRWALLEGFSILKRFFSSAKKKVAKLKKKIIAKPESDSLSDWKPPLSITGLDRVFNPEISVFRRIAWLSIIVLCSVTCAWQIRNTITEFRSGEPAIRTYYVTDRSIPIPSMTFCPYKHFEKNLRFKDMFDAYEMENLTISASDLIDKEGYTVAMLWEPEQDGKTFINSFEKKHDMVCFENEKQKYKGDCRSKIIPVKTIDGSCFTVKRNREVYRRMRSNVVLIFHVADINEPIQFEVFIHNDYEDPRYLNPLNAYLVPLSFPSQMAMVITQRKRLNRKEKPCIDKYENYRCRKECLEKHLSKVNCSLPFMPSMPNLRQCNTSKEFNDTLMYASRIYRNLSDQFCNCTLICDEEILTILPDTCIVTIGGSRVSRSEVIIYFPTNTYLIVEEYKAFTVYTVFGDISGNLGLFLSISALTLFETLEFFLEKILRIFIPKKILRKL